MAYQLSLHHLLPLLSGSRSSPGSASILTHKVARMSPANEYDRSAHQGAINQFAPVNRMATDPSGYVTAIPFGNLHQALGNMYRHRLVR